MTVGDNAVQNPESVTYLHKVLPCILTTWDIRQLDGQVRPEFYKRSSREHVERLFSRAKRSLGSLRSFSIIWRHELRRSVHGASYDEAAFLIQGVFAKKTAKISVVVLKAASQWRITNLGIERQSLMEPIGGGTVAAKRPRQNSRPHPNPFQMAKRSGYGTLV